MIKPLLILSGLGIALFLVIYFSGNTERKLKKELKQLIEVSPFSATGSDLMLAVFGWPSTQKLVLKEVKVSVDPQSSSKSGSATATISGIANGTDYYAEVWFTYFGSYTGGHGYSGGTGLGLSNFQRENEVPAAICQPTKFTSLKPGEAIQDSLTAESYRFPDGSLANYYQLSIAENISEYEIEIAETDKTQLSVKSLLFKDCKMVTRFNKRNTGTFILLVTGGEKTGTYSIKLHKTE